MIARLVISSSSGLRKEEIVQTLRLHLKGIKLNHPDILYFLADSKLGIEQARKIKEHFSLKPYGAKGRAVVLEDAESLTIEAQNALLKTIEELPESAILILGASSDEKFLRTILSRCQIIRIKNQEPRMKNEEALIAIEELIKKDISERFEYIEKLKDREEFLKALVRYFHQNLHLHLKGVKLNFLKELMQAEKWVKQNVNTRAILEYLMLVMPQKL